MPEEAKIVTRRRDEPSETEGNEFEELIDRMSGALESASVEDIDPEIERWLREMIITLDLDRGAVWERASSEVGFIATYWWARPEIPPLPPKMRSMQISPWITAQILDGRTVVYASPEELPKRAVKLRNFLKVHGPKAQVVLPIYVAKRVLGGLTFGKFRGQCAWSANDLRRLRIAGRIIAAALERKHAALSTRDFREKINAGPASATKIESRPSRAQKIPRAQHLDLERRFKSLPPRQREVFILITAGLLNKEVAAELGITEQTVKVHRARLRRRMGSDSLAELSRMAAILQIHPPPSPTPNLK